MPVGKTRTNKRSSGTYTSTVTTIVFIALCVLGVWMLTSNSVIPSQTTSQSSTEETSSESSTSLQTDEKISGAFEDNPGQLPEDAIKPDDKSKLNQESDEKRQPVKQEISDVAKKEQEKESVYENKNAGEETHQGKDNNLSGESTLTTQAHGDRSVDQDVTQGAGMNENQQPKDDQESNIDRKEPTKKKKKRPRRKRDPSEEGVHEGTSHDQADHDNQKPQEATTIPQNELKTQGADTAQQESRSNIDTTQREEDVTKSSSNGSFLGGTNAGIPKESKDSKNQWSTQADQSENEKERRKEGEEGSIYGHTWQLCNVTAGTDYIPCLDNEKYIKKLRSRKHYEHRERHCPDPPPTCLVPLPDGYKTPIEWPHSRDKIWYHNVPHTLLAEVKGHQNWVKLTGEHLTFPGGGTQFIHGALHYIDLVQEAVPNIAWGIRTRVILDVGCGVASFGGFLFERDVLAMSFAPKDEHEAQVQFALERGIPAISAVMGTQRLQFPSMVFDMVHCARCRVPWHADGGALLLELNRVLRPGGYFVWSATPVYQTEEEDVQIWNEMSALTISMCWELVTTKKDEIDSVGFAIYQKPISNECYDKRENSIPPICKPDDDPNAAWYVALQSCMHHVPVDEGVRGSMWPESWPHRVEAPPYWLNKSQMGVYGKPSPTDFETDYQHWKRVVSTSYLNGLGISWNKNIRNVMDMRAVYGGFAAAIKDMKVWVMNVVNVDAPDTLPVIYERGLIGMYHDWCESFSTYPRTYDLLHADHLFSGLQKRCNLAPVMAEVDRIVRPGGKLIVRDESKAIGEVENLLKSLHWEVHLTFSKNEEGILSAQKSNWRPDTYITP